MNKTAIKLDIFNLDDESGNIHGLLFKFIKSKLNKYIEPQRKDTPKGHAIGFSRKKYKAILYLLTSYKIKNIAKEVGVSEALLRKWKTEGKFIKKIEEHKKEFIKYHLEGLKKLKGFADEAYKIEEEILDKTKLEHAVKMHDIIEKRGKLNTDNFILDDYRFYNASLLANIIEDTCANCKEMWFTNYWFKLIFLFPGYSQIAEVVRRRVDSYTIIAIEWVQKMITKKSISDTDRRIMLLTLHNIKQVFESRQLE